MAYYTIVLVVCVLLPSILTENVLYVDENEIPELQYLNRSVDPCENFYEFTCGNFKNVKPRPEDEPTWDHFTILQKEVYATVRTILESKREENEPKSIQKAKSFYKGCLNEEYIDSLELAEARIVRQLGGFPLIGTDFNKKKIHWEEIGDIVAEYGLSLLFDISVNYNIYNGTENAIWLQKDPIQNPSNIMHRIEHNFEDYLGFKGKGRSGGDSPFMRFLFTIARKIKGVLNTYKSDDVIQKDLEEMIQFYLKITQQGIIDKEVSYLSPAPTLQELQKWTDLELGPNVINWKTYLTHVFRRSGVKVNKNTQLLVVSPDAVYGILNLVKQTDPRVVQNFILTRLFIYTASDSHKTMRDAFNKFYKEQSWPTYSRPEYCLRKTIGIQSNLDFSMALTYAYQRYYFNINKLAKAAEMVNDLHGAFGQILDSLDWMDDYTKQLCHKKAGNMVTLLGYPEFVEEMELLDEFYENVQVCTWDHFGNSQRMRSFRLALKLREMGHARDRSVWSNSPLDVNAYYSRVHNRIVFPLSILDPVFFTGYISALDYGRIGAIIGHEITHGFDNKGRLYNDLGNLGQLWSESTTEKYQKKTECFKDQYSQFYIEEIDKYINGTTTLDENLADNGGLRESYIAFQSLKGRQAQVAAVENFTSDQLLFIGYGTMWCMQESNYYLENLHKTGLYSPGRFRVNGVVANNEYFASAFNCPANSKMNPDKKCVLW